MQHGGRTCNSEQEGNDVLDSRGSFWKRYKVLNRLLRNEKVAACCGQIHPTGSGYLVAYQRFEYAVGHWLQKTTEHVLGCVLCSPGCFSLIRMSALAGPNVMAMYKSIAKTPLQKLQYDQGEDRWLCTLMLTAGGRIEFEASSHCNTFAPEDLDTFYKQGRGNFIFHFSPLAIQLHPPLVDNFRLTSGPFPVNFRSISG